MTATSPWIYNQVGANLTGVLVVLLGLGLWRALSPDVIGRIGVAVLIAEGTSTFFDGIFQLDCQGIDATCDNVSWHSRSVVLRLAHVYKRRVRRPSARHCRRGVSS